MTNKRGLEDTVGLASPVSKQQSCIGSICKNKIKGNYTFSQDDEIKSAKDFFSSNPSGKNMRVQSQSKGNAFKLDQDPDEDEDEDDDEYEDEEEYEDDDEDEEEDEDDDDDDDIDTDEDELEEDKLNDQLSSIKISQYFLRTGLDSLVDRKSFSPKKSDKEFSSLHQIKQRKLNESRNCQAQQE